MPRNIHTRRPSPIALILLDVINHFDFPDGDRILKEALPMAPRLAKLNVTIRRGPSENTVHRAEDGGGGGCSLLHRGGIAAFLQAPALF